MRSWSVRLVVVFACSEVEVWVEREQYVAVGLGARGCAWLLGETEWVESGGESVGFYK